MKKKQFLRITAFFLVILMVLPQITAVAEASGIQSSQILYEDQTEFEKTEISQVECLLFCRCSIAYILCCRGGNFAGVQCS